MPLQFKAGGAKSKISWVDISFVCWNSSDVMAALLASRNGGNDGYSTESPIISGKNVTTEAEPTLQSLTMQPKPAKKCFANRDELKNAGIFTSLPAQITTTAVLPKAMDGL